MPRDGWVLPYVTVISRPFVVAITCTPLLFRAVSSEDTGLWSVVNVTCPAGQRLNSEATSMITICNDHGMWDPAVPDCEGTSTAQKLHVKFTCSRTSSFNRCLARLCNMIVRPIHG